MTEEDRVKALEKEVELLKELLELREKLSAYEQKAYYPPQWPNTWYPPYLPYKITCSSCKRE